VSVCRCPPKIRLAAAKLSPVHNLRSVERYAQTYKNVLKLLEHGLASSEIAAILKLSNRLMDAYIDMVRAKHPEMIAANSYLQPEAPSPGSESS
jgi:DNA-binding NarL/FixJ family response regulator